MSEVITSQKLGDFSGVKAIVSTKSFGNQSFQHPSISEKETILNRNRFFSDQKIDSGSVVNVGLSHGNKVYWTVGTDRGRGSIAKKTIIPNYDGLVTDEKNMFLMVTVADCFPIFYYDPIAGCIGLVHVGWKGVLNGITIRAVEVMMEKSKCKASDIVAYVGPGIHICHFEVSDKLADQFENAFEFIANTSQEGRKTIDLPLMIKSQLEQSGILANNIEISPMCTYCEGEKLSSFRRDKENYIAQAAIIGMI